MKQTIHMRNRHEEFCKELFDNADTAPCVCAIMSPIYREMHLCMHICVYVSLSLYIYI